MCARKVFNIKAGDGSHDICTSTGAALMDAQSFVQAMLVMWRGIIVWQYMTILEKLRKEGVRVKG